MDAKIRGERYENNIYFCLRLAENLFMTRDKNHKRSSLKVNKGVEQPSSVSEEALQRFKNIKQKPLVVDDYIKGIRSGDRTILSKAITLIESSLPGHQETAQKIIEQCVGFSGNSIRIGITGVPGVGKSTFIEEFGKQITQKGDKLAVLTIDPSSQRSKGSILGDKTRMELLSTDPNAFIRPSPSSGSLGGVARTTRESIILCEAAGYNVIIIETVGVGQSETTVHSMVDFFLLLMLAGAGDELQGIKRGIIEMADAIFINKADGDNLEKANIASQMYKNALHLLPPAESGWDPMVDVCSAVAGTGISNAWNIILKYRDLTKGNGYFDKKRMQQLKQSMLETINRQLNEDFYNSSVIQATLPEIEKQLFQSQITSFAGARKLIDMYIKKLKEQDG